MQAGDILTEAEADYIDLLEGLLVRAANSLQYYCSELNGDMNDSLATEIERLLNKEIDA